MCIRDSYKAYHSVGLVSVLDFLLANYIQEIKTKERKTFESFLGENLHKKEAIVVNIKFLVAACFALENTPSARAN